MVCNELVSVSAAQIGMQQSMKQMLAGFASDGKSPRVVSARVQTPLDRLTDRHILVLNTLAHFDTREIALPRLLANDIRKVKIENDFCLVHPARHDEVRIHHAVVPVDHERSEEHTSELQSQSNLV